MNRALQAEVWKRAANRCEYCQMPTEFDELEFEIDHVIAEQHGGLTVSSNFALACFTCNRHKGPNLSGIDPHSDAIVSLFHPRRHQWSRHFRWDGPWLVGKLHVVGRP